MSVGAGIQRRPNVTLYQPALPARGVGFSIVVPPGEAWRIVSMRMVLTFSATAGNRVFVFGYQDSASNEFFGIGTDIVGTAGQLIELNAGLSEGAPGAPVTRNWPYEGLATFTYISLLDTILPAGYKLIMGAANGFDGNPVTGDQWNALMLGVEKYPA